MSDLIKRNFINLIFEFRGYKVMLDYDLAKLYETETKRLKEQVRRNINRFPSDFMFELNEKEFELLRSQIATSKRRGGLRYKPMAFTEQGVSMLSSVLNSEKAILVNIEIMRVFAQYRGMLREYDELKREVKDLDKKLDGAFRYLLERIDALHQQNKKWRRKKIGFKLPVKKNK